jgi:ATP-dependent Lon protease
VLIPRDNEKDLKEVPDEILKGLTVVPVDHVDDVLPHALLAEADAIFNGMEGHTPLSCSLRKGAEVPASTPQ